MKKILKPLITDFRKINLYGDVMVVSQTRTVYPFRGKRLDVKILGLFWVKYTYYTVRPSYYF